MNRRQQHPTIATATGSTRAALAALVGLVALCAAFPALVSAVPHAMDPPTVSAGETVAVAAGTGGVGSLSFSMEAGGMAVSLDSNPDSRILLQTRQGGKVFWCFAAVGSACDRPAVMLTTPGNFSATTTPLTEDVVLELGSMIDGTSQATRNEVRVVARDVARMVWSAGMDEVPSSSTDPTAPRSVVPGASILATKDSDDLIVEPPQGGALVVENSLVVDKAPTVHAANFHLEWLYHSTVTKWEKYIKAFPTFSDDRLWTGAWMDVDNGPTTYIVGGTLNRTDEANGDKVITNVSGRKLHLVGGVDMTMVRRTARNATEPTDPILYTCLYRPAYNETDFNTVPWEFVRLSDSTIGGRVQHTYERMFTLQPNETVRLGFAYGDGNQLKSVVVAGRYWFRELH